MPEPVVLAPSGLDELRPDGDQHCLRLGAEDLGDDRLAVSEPIRNRSQGTLFALTPGETTYLLSWLKERDSNLPDFTDPGKYVWVATQKGDEEIGVVTKIFKEWAGK